MSQFVEFEGKNMDKALEKASVELKIPIEKLEYDVVSYGSSGIFGLVGAKKAKIRIKNKGSRRHDSETKSQAKDLVKDAFNLKEDKPAQSPTQETAKKPEKPPADFDHAIKVGEEALQRFADFITNDGQIVTEMKDQRIIFKIEGGNSGMLIGKRGQTLEAMQYLVEKIVNKQNEQRVRVLVDVEGYLRLVNPTCKKWRPEWPKKPKEQTNQ